MIICSNQMILLLASKVISYINELCYAGVHINQNVKFYFEFYLKMKLFNCVLIFINLN